MSIKVEALVIGAGPTGIGAAVRLRELGIEHLVVDAGDGPGGMAASRTDAFGFTWDLGGHVIHSHFDEFDDAVRRSGAPLRLVERNGWVWQRGDDPSSMLPSPIQAYCESMPEDLDPEAPAANLAEYYRNCFGEQLCKEFFTPYNEKMWTVPLEEVDHLWTSLRSGGNGRNVPHLSLAGGGSRPREAFPYPIGGTGALWTAITRELARPECFRYGARVEALDLAGRRARLEDGREIEYGMLVSTAPMPWMMEQMGMPGPADRLHSSAELAVGIGMEGSPPPALDGVTWVYCPDRSVPWFRGTVLSTYEPDAAGDGRWSILLEVSVPGGVGLDRERAVRECVRSLERLGASGDDIVSVWTEFLSRGYPVPTLGRDEVLRRVDDALVSHGVRSRGRFGGWRYESCNQDYSYMQGRQAVDAEMRGAQEDVLWYPERF